MSKLEKSALTKLSEYSGQIDPRLFDSIPVDLKKIGGYWGVQRIIKRKLDVAGLLYRLDSGAKVVFLNEGDSSGRQRFSWAHELGHIVLAGEDMPQVSCRKANKFDKELERSCDVIATEILMPNEIFSQAASQIGWTLQSARTLANNFQVTMQAAALRIVELSTQPLAMSVWQLKKGTAMELRSKWSRSSASAKSMRPSFKWNIDPDIIHPIYEAFQSPGIKCGPCHVLQTSHGDRNFKPVPTEAVGVGSGNTRTVIGFHILGRGYLSLITCMLTMFVGSGFRRNDGNTIETLALQH